MLHKLRFEKMASANAALIEEFYTAFQEHDAERMAKCYHEEITFEDPAFGPLKGSHAPNMWRMLLRRSEGLEITFSNVKADETTGSAHWEAKYKFSGRPVHNKIDASFTFKDGKIATHIDKFDGYAWAKQAFGFLGTVVGWTPVFKNYLRKTVNKQLARYEAKYINNE